MSTSLNRNRYFVQRGPSDRLAYIRTPDGQTWYHRLFQIRDHLLNCWGSHIDIDELPEFEHVEHTMVPDQRRRQGRRGVRVGDDEVCCDGHVRVSANGNVTRFMRAHERGHGVVHGSVEERTRGRVVERRDAAELVRGSRAETNLLVTPSSNFSDNPRSDPVVGPESTSKHPSQRHPGSPDAETTRQEHKEKEEDSSCAEDIENTDDDSGNMSAVEGTQPASSSSAASRTTQRSRYAKERVWWLVD